MPKLDRFSAQLVSLVRQMPDEALLAMVKNQLGGVMDAKTVRSTTTKAKTGRKAAAKLKSAARKPAAARGNRAALLNSVEKLVRASKGVGLADVAKATGAPKGRLSAALRELKAAGRIAQGGDRRFARYAANTKTALAASKRARAGR